MWNGYYIRTGYETVSDTADNSKQECCDASSTVLIRKKELGI